jgi:hypothetical protein
LRDYRVYYLDANGRVLRREALLSESDERAIALLEQSRSHPVIELWELGRFVKRIVNS